MNITQRGEPVSVVIAAHIDEIKKKVTTAKDDAQKIELGTAITDMKKNWETVSSKEKRFNEKDKTLITEIITSLESPIRGKDKDEALSRLERLNRLIHPPLKD